MKKIIIFGANGGTGKQLIKQALEKGYEVTAFVRSLDKLTLQHSCLKIVQGNVLKYSEVNRAIKNQEAVICCIGTPASDRSGLREKGTINIIKAMEENGIKRFICQSSLGFGDSKEILPWHMKYIIAPLVLKNAFADHSKQEKVVKQSKLDWTIIRPANLTNGQFTGKYKHGFEHNEKIKLKISRADVAHLILNQLDSNQYIHKKVGISY